MIFIPGNVPSSKNSKQWTGKFLVTSKTVKKYVKQSEPYWIQFRPQFNREIKGLELPYRIKFTFIRNSRHKFDLANPLQTIQDLMVKYEWIPDDNADILQPVFGKYRYYKENPGVWIKVLT